MRKPAVLKIRQPGHNGKAWPGPIEAGRFKDHVDGGGAERLLTGLFPPTRDGKNLVPPGSVSQRNRQSAAGLKNRLRQSLRDILGRKDDRPDLRGMCAQHAADIQDVVDSARPALGVGYAESDPQGHAVAPTSANRASPSSRETW